MGHYVRLKAADGFELDAWRADPAGKPRAGLVVAMGIFGVNDYIRGQVDHFAELGFAAIAPAVFDRVQRGVDLGIESEAGDQGRRIRGLANEADMMLDLEAAAAAVRPAGKVAILGYCWGGCLAWMGATRTKAFDCCVSYYGGGVHDRRNETPNCPVQFHFGDSDRIVPMEHIDAIRAANPDIPTFVYRAGHAFATVGRNSFDAEATREAEKRALAFLAEHTDPGGNRIRAAG
jgi:carboxymethylenebutenolidase